MTRRLISIVAALAMCILGAASASAQSALSQVLDLNRQGMTAYQNLELEQAQQALERALQVAERRGVTGAPLARTYLNLGVVAVGGFGDNGRGLQFFVQALTADPTIQLDPLTSTPEIQTVFTLARQQAGTGGGDAGNGGSAGNTGNAGDGGGAGSGGGVGGNLPHVPVPEQLAQTAVPVYIEVPGSAAHVYVYYRGHGMREFRRVEMQRVANGFGYEIPCTDVFQPSIEYYIVAFGRDGSPLGFAGTQNDPVSVPIVASRSQPAPALPGRAPPQQCGDEECPPGMEGCHASAGGGGMGSTCRVDGDCGSGLVCRDDLCVAGESSGAGGGGEQGDPTHFFVQVGATLGLGYAQSGMLADSYPCTEADVQAGLCPAANDTAAFVPGGTAECNAGDGYYCVKVGQAGFVPQFALRFALGYYFHFFPRLGIALFGRISPFSGQGDLAFGVFGARVQFRVTDPASTGVDLALHLGGGGGQVQIQPPGNGDNAPYIISGYGNISFGSTFSYRFIRNFGIMAELDFMFMVPSFMFVTDITAGVEVAF